MKFRRLAPILITLLAGFAFLYPLSTATRAQEGNSTPAASKSISGSDSPEGRPGRPKFPTAKDLVSAFLFSGEGKRETSSGLPRGPSYSIDFLIATAPDPISSRLPHFFDSFIESLENAVEAAGYTPDRFALPWLERANGTADDIPSWHRPLYESAPGLILFRDSQHQKLLLVFLVGETPTTGIHEPAMFSALEQMAQFYPWDPRHAELPPDFPQTESAGGGETWRIMGPSFSGSADSLSFVLEKWRASRAGTNLQFQIISGTATAIDASWILQAAALRENFYATVPPDSETLPAVACYIAGLSDSPKIAILTEGNTQYGQNFKKESAPGKMADSPNRGGCGNGNSLPEILSLPFPMHISRLRAAAVKAKSEQGQTETATGGSTPYSTPTSQESVAEPREVLPPFSDLSVQSAQLTLANLLSTIAREEYHYVGIVATDVRDVTFLAREVREHCPSTVLFTLNSDLLYAHPDVNSATRGMITFTPYPLFNLEQLWTYAYGGDVSRLQFANQASEGVYNATLALLGQDGKLVDYGKPLPGAANVQPLAGHKPSLWVTAIGDEKTLPVRLLEWKDDRNYTYSPATSDDAIAHENNLKVGRGIYAENNVVAVIALSIFIFGISLVILSQYGRPEKSGAGRDLAFLGDTVSPAYSAECRLFLLCGCVSLLAFYVVLVAAFCLPFVTGLVLGGGIETTSTPIIAACFALVTTLLLLLATYTLLNAFCKAPSAQRGSAPEVMIFTLFSCSFVFTLAVLFATTWLKDVRAWPASGLFNHLRSFDLRGGLSPLLPLSCVAIGACLWALCSFRRLRLIDILRATQTNEKPHSWLSFLSLDVPSFNGVRELENSVKHILESSSVISLRWYTALMAMGLVVGHYFFATRLVRALEPRPFYWLFEAAFIIVYWALLTEFLRLVFAWRSLHLLLQRVSWHPLLDACKRYRESRPNLAKMNLTHPPSSFAALESSVHQAAGLVRTAKTLAQAAELDDILRELFRQSLPEWEGQVQNAETQVCEALRLQWTDDSPAEATSLGETVRKKRASRLQGNWRLSLLFRCHAHHGLFRFSQSLGKLMEGYWLSIPRHLPPPAPAAAAKEFFDQGEEFMVGRLVNFLAIVFPSLQNLGYFVLAGLLLMLLAITSYPFQPRNEFLFFNWVVILSFVGTVFWIFIQMDRDAILSLLNDTQPGEINFSRELVLRTLLYVAVPLLALLGAQFPESLRQILSLFTAAQGGP